MRLLLGVLLAVLAASPVTAAPLHQAPGAAGCAAHDGAESCARVAALRGDADVAVSPDGRFLYVTVTGRRQGAVATFRRSRTGRLSRLAVRRGKALRPIANIEVTPDGRHVYGTGLAAFRRDKRSGRLTRIRAPRTTASRDLVIAPDGRHLYVSGPLRAFARDARTGRLRRISCSACGDLGDASALAMSPDGASLYVAVQDDTIVALRRDARTGALQPLARDRRCVSAAAGRDGCRPARAIRGIGDLTVTADGADLYASASRFSDDSGERFLLSSGIALLRRDPADGALTQPDGPAGCFAYSGDEEQGCARGGALFAPSALAVTPDGRALLAVHTDLSAVRLLRRDPATGALAEDVCVARGGRDGNCIAGRGLRHVAALAIAPDGRGIVTAGFGSAASFLLGT